MKNSTRDGVGRISATVLQDGDQPPPPRNRPDPGEETVEDAEYEVVDEEKETSEK